MESAVSAAVISRAAGQLRRHVEKLGEFWTGSKDNDPDPEDNLNDEGDGNDDVEAMEGDGNALPEHCGEGCATEAKAMEAGEPVLGVDSIKPDREQAAPPTSIGMPYGQPEGSTPAADEMETTEADGSDPGEQSHQDQPGAQGLELLPADGASMDADQDTEAQCRLLIRLPSGTTYPMTAPLTATVAQLKEALLRQCGWTREQLPALGVALGLSALREELSLASNDVSPGDTLTIYLRT